MRTFADLKKGNTIGVISPSGTYYGNSIKDITTVMKNGICCKKFHFNFNEEITIPEKLLSKTVFVYHDWHYCANKEVCVGVLESHSGKCAKMYLSVLNHPNFTYEL